MRVMFKMDGLEGIRERVADLRSRLQERFGSDRIAADLGSPLYRSIAFSLGVTMKEDRIPQHHLEILGAVAALGKPGDYSEVYRALPDVPQQTIRAVALRYGKGLGEPRKHPRPEVVVNLERIDRQEILESIAAEIPSSPSPARHPQPQAIPSRAREVIFSEVDGSEFDVTNTGLSSDRGDESYDDEIPSPIRREDPSEDLCEEDFSAMAYPGGEKDLAVADRPFFRAMGESTRLMVEHLGRLSPRWPDPPLPPRESHYATVVGLADIHLGKLAWARETGHDYDLAIGDRIFRNGVADLVERIYPFGVEEIVAPIGNDFFHYDNLLRTTTKGTWIDSDGRYPKVFHRGYEACCHAVELMRATGAEVRVLHVPGNHDRLSSWHLCRELWLTFRNAPGVEIDMEPRTRKYHEYGRNLFGFDHGDKIQERELPTLMAFECREQLAGKTCLEWFIGHHHRSKRTRLLPEEDTFAGCSINWIPSLCGADSFLFEKGYIRGGRAARAYLYDRDGGREAYFEVRAREA